MWLTNPEVEVERALRVFGLLEKRSTVFRVKPSTDMAESIGLPTPTTYDAALRHYLVICGPISRLYLEL